MTADLELIEYIHPNGSNVFCLQVKMGDKSHGLVAFVPDLSAQQVIGLLLFRIPVKTITVDEEN